jgi:hypothetical protein
LGLHNQDVILWWWDADLIASLPYTVTALNLPNMRADGHIQRKDIELLTPFASSLHRLELFRPMPRQPWGVEALAFLALAPMLELKELVVRSGRLVGNSEQLVQSVVDLVNLEVLEVCSDN